MFLKTCIFLIFTLSLVSVSSNTNHEGVVTWADFTTKSIEKSYELSNYLQPVIFRTVSNSNVSELCAKSLLRYFNGLKEWEPWAIQMFDATGKFPSGFLSGTKSDFGSYDQCLEIRANQNEESTSFKGQFCMLDIKTPLISQMTMKTPSNKSYIETYGMPPKWIYDMLEEQDGMLLTFGLYLGVCTPSTCSQQDIYRILTHVSEPAGLKISVTDCQNDQPKQWHVSAVVSMYILVGLLATCAIGTILDILDRRIAEDSGVISNKSYSRRSLKAFSLYTNTKQLFESPSKQISMDFLHGIRVLLCIWIIMCHIGYLPFRWKENIYINYNRVIRMHLENPALAVIQNAVLAIGNYFHISGFLLTYFLWRKLEKSGGKLNVLQNAFNKYCRLTPSHLFFIIISFVVPVIYNGPIWNSTWEEEVGKCLKFGWRNLFYIHNFLSSKEICGVHTWFLGAMFQVQVVSLFLLALTFRSPKKGIFVGLLLFVGCFINDYTTSIRNNYPFQSVEATRSFELMHQIANKIYFRPFHHFGAHLIGMVLGWYIYKHKDHKLHPKYYVLGWIVYSVGSILMLLVIWYPIKDFRIAAFYNASRLTIWSLLFSWLVYCCTTGSGGLVNRLLSWKALVPISHISYSVYLVHPIINLLKASSVRGKLQMSLTAAIVELPFHLTASFGLGFLLYITVEVPFNTLFDLWLSDSPAASIKESVVTNVEETITAKNGKVLEKES